MCPHQAGPCPRGERQRRGWGPLALILLVLQASCAALPRSAQRVSSRSSAQATAAPQERASPARGSEPQGAVTYEVAVLEPGAVTIRVVPIARADFQRTLVRLAREVQWQVRSPQQAARELLVAHPQLQLEGDWLAEVYRGRVLSVVPLGDMGPLSPEAEESLRREYLSWCGQRGGGDCLRLFEDGPYLRAEDRRTLALALAFGSVLEETSQALARELNPMALVAMVVWAVGIYLGMLLLPEPVTMFAAATLSLLLVAWLGVDMLAGLINAWAGVTTQAYEATTFDELRASGEGLSKVLGTDVARVLVLAVATLTGRTLGEVAARVRSLPGYNLAAVQWEAQQGGAAVLGRLEAVEAAVAQEAALVKAVAAVESVALSAQGPLAAVMLKQRAGTAPGGGSPTTVIRHRGGNQQVLLGNGQRWHLSRGKSLRDIPAEDKVGDMLQEAVTRAAREWGPEKLSRNERRAIQDALAQGEYWLARLLEREARGRFVEEQVYQQFRHLYGFSRNKGIDIVDPATGRQYEILSGTESNLARHGRRMATEFFRMLTF